MSAISADTQIGFLRDCIAEAEEEIQRYREAGNTVLAGETKHVMDIWNAILETVITARALYENRASSDPVYLSDLFHAVAPVNR